MVIEMAFSNSLSLGSEYESTSSSDDLDLRIEEKIQNLWGDKTIDAMKRIWPSYDSEVVTQSQKSPIWVEKSTLAMKNVMATYDTRFSYSKACEYGQPLHPGFVSINTRHTLPVKYGFPVGGTFVPFDPMKKNLGQLVDCFVILESLDRNIKICEILLGITSICHGVVLPWVYNVMEIRRLLGYSEAQLIWYNKFAEHVKAKFILESKRQEACNKNVALWNNLCGGVIWGKCSFEHVIFSTMVSIENKWSRANKNISVLLEEDPLCSTHRLLSIYFKELRDVISNAKTSVWALTEKVKMILKAPTPELVSYDIIQYITPTPSSSYSGSSKSPDEACNYRKRRGKNFIKF